MKREIKFRGKNYKGEWVYGDLLRNRGETFIAPAGISNPFAVAEDFKVDSETVGQFTGLVDMKKQEIYEGDILESLYYPLRGDVFMGMAMWMCDGDSLNDVLDDKCDIIGNIHDNPDLLKMS